MDDGSEKRIECPTFLKLDFLTSRTPVFPQITRECFMFLSLTTVSPAVQANNTFCPVFIFFSSINPLLN